MLTQLNSTNLWNSIWNKNLQVSRWMFKLIIQEIVLIQLKKKKLLQNLIFTDGVLLLDLENTSQQVQEKQTPTLKLDDNLIESKYNFFHDFIV